MEDGISMSIEKGLKRGTIELVLLTLLQRKDMYGYEICQEFDSQSNGLFTVTEGSLYPVLYRLLDKGYISDRSEKVGKRRTRVYYHLEPAGQEYLSEIKKEYISLNRGILLALGYGDLEEFTNGKD
jgi:PadR family transcriptional regulator PadR